MSITVWCWGQHEGDSPEERRRATEKHVLTEEQAVRLLEWFSAEDWEDRPRCVWEIVDQVDGPPDGHPDHDLVNLLIRLPNGTAHTRSSIFRTEAKHLTAEHFGCAVHELEWDKNMVLKGEEITRLQSADGTSVGIALITPARKP